MPEGGNDNGANANAGNGNGNGSGASFSSTNYRNMTGYFSGDNQESLVECRDFHRRFCDYATIAQWNSNETCKAFGFVLRGKASMWFKNYCDDHPTRSEEWEQLQQAFLKRFDPSGRADEKLQGIEDLQMRSSETVMDFADRVKYTWNYLSNQEEEQTLANDSELEAYRMGRESTKVDSMKLYFMNGIPRHIKATIIKQSLRGGFDKMVEAAQRAEHADKTEKRLRKGENLPIASMKEETKTEQKKKEERKEEPVSEQLQQLRDEIAAFTKMFPDARPGGNKTRGRGGYRGNINRGRGNYYNGNNQYRRYVGNGGGNNRRIYCFRCKKWSTHRANTCPVPTDQLAALEMDGDHPNYDHGEHHPYDLITSPPSLNE